MRSAIFIPILCILSIASFAAAPDLFVAVRNGDSRALQQLLAAKADPNATDSYGTTPLMYAAAYGSLESLSSLLAAGAKVNAQTALGSTALMWASADTAKLRILLQAGADPKLRASNGATALLCAALRDNVDAVRLLWQAGSDPNADMRIIPVAPFRMGLARIAYSTNSPALREFLREVKFPVSAASLPPIPTFTPFSNLFSMTGFSLRYQSKPGLSDALQAILALEADPNREERQLTKKSSTLALAASHSDTESVRLLLEAGAKPNSIGSQGITPLMVAVSTEEPDLQLLRLLLDKGASVEPKDDKGRTALDWALTQGESPVTTLLRQHGAKVASPAELPTAPQPIPKNAREALQKALAQLQTAAPAFHARAGCISCHHQSLTAVAVHIAAKHNVPINEELRSHPSSATFRMWEPSREDFLMGNCSIFGFLGNVSYGLFSLAEEGAAPSNLTDAALSCLLSLQQPDGRWQGGDMRPPLAGRTPLLYTALAVRALSRFAPPALSARARGSVESARRFLLNAPQSDTQGEAFRLMGLVWSGAGADRIRRQRAVLTSLQKADGGWSQLPAMKADAYATGQALYALHLSGSKTTELASRRGREFLLRTQHPDGTWFVRSRAMGFQPYIDSGFPYGADQFISAAATAWAAIALGVAL